MVYDPPRGTFVHGWPYFVQETMTEELFRRFVEAVEIIAALHVAHEERSIARAVLEQQAHADSVAIAERQTAALQQMANQQESHITQCEASHKRTEDMARARLQETLQ